MSAKIKVEEFQVIKVGDKYWMEEFPPGRSDVSEKGFTDDLHRAYRIRRSLEERALPPRPVQDYLRPDLPGWYPELLTGKLVWVSLVQYIKETYS